MKKLQMGDLRKKGKIVRLSKVKVHQDLLKGFVIVLFLVGCGFPIALLFSESYAQTKMPRLSSVVNNKSADSPVKVETVTKVFIAKDAPAYLISYSYDFDRATTVYIKGLGLVPPNGSYTYLSKEQELEFRDPERNVVLTKVPLQETTIVAARPPLNEVPSENQFPPGYRAYIWDVPTSLQARANAVLARYFNYLPRENNRLTYLATTYTPVQLDKKISDLGVFAQLALLISFPHNSLNEKYSFHVQHLVKEGRVLSDVLKLTNNPDIINAANNFIDRLITEMKQGK